MNYSSIVLSAVVLYLQYFALLQDMPYIAVSSFAWGCVHVTGCYGNEPKTRLNKCHTWNAGGVALYIDMKYVHHSHINMIEGSNGVVHLELSRG